MERAFDPAWEKAKLALRCCAESLETNVCPDGCPWEKQCWFDDDAKLYLPAVREALKAMEAEEHLILHTAGDAVRSLDFARDDSAGEARLMSLEELRRSHGHGFEEVSFSSDVQNPEEVVIWECVWLNGRIMMENDSTASAWAGPYAENYGKWGGCRVWSGLPTEQQRMEAPWGESP